MSGILYYPFFCNGDSSFVFYFQSRAAESLQTTQTTDYSNSSHTASVRCEATFESTFKQSLFESQLEDYTNDLQRLLSDTDSTPMDLLKDKHIYLPKQTVYETDVLNLTEKVEGLKWRMRDLDKPLKIVNRNVWEEVRNSSEKELKSFGAKLKERNNLFRKLSKVQSHEMKEVLFSNILQASLEAEQKSRATIEEADEMLKSLDDCIRDLETELAAVEEKGFEDKPSLKSRQEEMQKVAEALAENEQQIVKLEMQKKQNSNKLNRLKAETRKFESQVDVLQRVNEWKFAEKTDNGTTYTFLHDTLHLQLVYEESCGEKSRGHACLVHALLSEYIEGESDWLGKYPTSRHVPTLLHDVGLVASRCRLLGEELRLLQLWGGLRLDILNISCVDTRVHIVFSRLKTLSKFEVIFSVSLVDRLCVLQVQSFTNVIGNTTIQQIEDIVASFSPAKNVLTKIIKSIHENLLC
ncbi:Protein CASC5 [Liparis tanakae]|uniref:Protein CASC5 n=1 Tax=Liparis tanakae TaxID=230148 RepID=A0A4Z2H5W8_9TELE|nr:Protein CASC5 [Liparis tanakae]